MLVFSAGLGVDLKGVRAIRPKTSHLLMTASFMMFQSHVKEKLLTLRIFEELLELYRGVLGLELGLKMTIRAS